MIFWECLVLKAEAWGMVEGIRCAIELRVENLQIESDSALLVSAVAESRPLGTDIDGIIKAIVDLLSFVVVWSIRHIWREANDCADALAALGRDNDGSREVVRFS